MNSPMDDTTANILQRLEEAEQLKLVGEHQLALDILEELLVEDLENLAAYEEIADNELCLERYDRAEAAAVRAIALDPESYTAHYIIGFIHSRNEDWDKGLFHLQKANALKGNNPEILRCLGWALFNTGQRAQGIVTLERALNLDTENTLTLCDLGVSYLQTRNFAKARTLFARALDLDPDNKRAHECLQAVQRLEKVVHSTVE